jgi:hypothetical protein
LWGQHANGNTFGNTRPVPSFNGKGHDSATQVDSTI